MKSNLFTKLSLILTAIAMMFTISACGRDVPIGVDGGQIADLQQQIRSLSARVEALEKRSGLESWDMQAEPWVNRSGATIRFRAVPVNHPDGQTAAFVVRLDGQEIADMDCAWDGTAYAATLDLDAADGYGFYCVLVSENGMREQFALNTPENPVEDALVYLRTAMISYANLVVESWHDAGGKLTVSSGYVQVQTPRLSADGNAVTYTGADLVLQLNGQELGRKELDLPAGEGANSYETELHDIAFDIPEIVDGDRMELWLEVSLSGGEELLTSGGSWGCYDGDLILEVG